MEQMGRVARGEVLPRQRDLGAEMAWMVKEMVRQMVADPDQAVVTGTRAGDVVMVTVQVSSRDMGRVVGKRGETARSLRVLLRAAGRMNRVSVELNIQEALHAAETLRVKGRTA
jgi:hypothetical protein